MSEAFASTAAQTLPVLALAAVLEYRTSAERGRGFLLSRLIRWRVRHQDWNTGWQGFVAASASAVWFVVMACCVPAEAVALHRLRGGSVNAASETFVFAVLVAATALLVFYPLMMRATDAYAELLAARTTVAPSSSLDEVPISSDGTSSGEATSPRVES